MGRKTKFLQYTQKLELHFGVFFIVIMDWEVENIYDPTYRPT